ncbi:hypothetical protein tb265_35300 [Gemmatimonadetes bacterium T265]|nr:hypothetical protein tb265_35300 [Gemmatimonadetes bacterium T265]
MTNFRRGRAATLAAVAAAVFAVVPAVGCAPRPIQVTTGAEPAAAGLAFTNNLRTAVNVYVRGPSGDEVFVRQVPAGASESLVVRGIAPGARVSLRAAPVDGGPGFNRQDVVLGNGATWTVP